MSKRAKHFTRLAVATTGEVVISADLSATVIKRLIKEYARFGLDLVELH